MEISRAELEIAATEGIVSGEQAEALWAFLLRRAAAAEVRPDAPPKSKFDFVHVAYYFGAMLVIGAMGWFMTLGWEAFGGSGIFAIASTYALAFIFAGRKLWQTPDLKTPGGLCIAMAVGMTPLATYGIERMLGWWPQSDPGTYSGFHQWIKGGWFMMEMATVATAIIALRFFRFPFLTAIIGLIFWYVSMDLAPLLYGHACSWNERAWVSVAVGAVMLVVGFGLDRRTEGDFSYWFYLFGMLALWGGMSSMQNGNELRKFLYFLINLGFLGVAVILDRRVFAVFGAFGVMGYLGYLAHRVFANSVAFPFVVSFIGIAVIALGVKYHRNRERIEKAVLELVPSGLRSVLPRPHAK